ncbi:MAG: prepilin-type N-terminal cleavage/methylation domain-containing protein [Myxococcales bacterium]|nr:prepilin-type N-terminal cleavage/methylation domain-containing protein [Myxococcota bacterium]MDW8283067.1 prepilin-type N-terminal cleavage/methylation domain-containing protein [Myxococcales bacterium]
MRHRGYNGFTLPELLVVLLLLAVVATLGSFTLRHRNRAAAVAGMARQLQLMCLQARARAMWSRSLVRIRLDPDDSDRDHRVATLHVATVPGFNPAPLAFGPAEQSLPWHPEVRIVAVSQGVNLGGASPVGTVGVTSLTFFPDGAVGVAPGVQGATVYLADSASQHPHRVVIFGRTALAKVLDR